MTSKHWIKSDFDNNSEIVSVLSFHKKHLAEVSLMRDHNVLFLEKHQNGTF